MERRHFLRAALAGAAGLALGPVLPPPAAAARQNQKKPLPELPKNLPGWLTNRDANHVFWTRGKYNFAVYKVRPLALDLNAVSVGHSMAYEDMVTGRTAQLETNTFARIDNVLKNPPRFAPSERFIGNTFSRRFGVLEQVFDQTHLLHSQTVDVLAEPSLSRAEKEAEIERLYEIYRTTTPYAITPLPLNMGYLYGQSYSRAFRNRYPKVNGLFWGYHWLQGAMYDALYGLTLEEQRKVYDVLGRQYHDVELYRTDRIFMPMTAEVSPRFSARFPHIANVFDNLHMLHDMVNDILVTEGLTRKQQDEQVTRAIWLVMEKAHEGYKPGDAPEPNGWRDYRHMEGMPGMGLMPDMTPEAMFMQGLGWMSLGECHHCSMPLPEGRDAWRAHSVTADGWTMRVRCPLCARDMSLETKGRAVLYVSTESPERPLVLISDDQGNLTPASDRGRDVVFLEQEASHAGCSEWSQAFTNRAAFDAFVAANPEYRGAKARTLAEWSALEGKRPDTYFKRQGPPGNPFDGAAEKKNEGSKP
ncbi:MAG TPA: twin-arginine translocation signal domain-containing protein [Armatimonadaceae bacterium]|nr:twin-arginine translocation signal domain-containing protein [Armatimonadaceae bacterium]